jgi:ribonuclease H2 subunit B
MLNGDKVYRYDQNKTLTWLAKKIQLLAQTLKEESVYVGSGYCNTAYMNQTTTQSTEEEYLHYACGMVQDYVPPLIADLLDEKYHKVKQQVEENPPSAKVKSVAVFLYYFCRNQKLVYQNLLRTIAIKQITTTSCLLR